MSGASQDQSNKRAMFRNLYENQERVNFPLTIVLWLSAAALLVYAGFRTHELLWMLLAFTNWPIWTARALDKVFVIGGGLAVFGGIYLIDLFFNRAKTNRILIGRFCVILGILSLSLFSMEAIQAIAGKIVILLRLGTELLGGIGLYFSGRALIRGDDLSGGNRDPASSGLG